MIFARKTERMEELTPKNQTLEAMGDAVTHAANETLGKFTVKFLDILQNIGTWKNLFKLLGACIVIFVIWLIFSLIRKGIKKIPETKMDARHKNITLRFVSYTLYAIIVMYIFSMFGVKLSAIWGAAGIAGIAIGFAAQTSVSNLISGLFIIGEKSMKIGDFIIVNGVSGTVDEIGLLSVRIHNMDGQMIRIPNSTIINSNFQNNSYFKIRRFTFSTKMSYESDFEKAFEILKKVPENCPTVLSTPPSNAWFDGLEENGITMTLAVWINSSDLIQTKTDVYASIVKLFKENNLEIPGNKFDVKVRQQ